MDGNQHKINELSQHWVHSYEEDTDTETVFRPVDFAFPPSRGRKALDLRPDQSCSLLGIAAADGPQIMDGTWDIQDDDTLQLRIKCQDQVQVLPITSVDNGRLAIQKNVRSDEPNG